MILALTPAQFEFWFGQIVAEQGIEKVSDEQEHELAGQIIEAMKNIKARTGNDNPDVFNEVLPEVERIKANAGNR